ncbi:uncharacterized protein N7459_006487 [Penicillium hispanicum]|uniref:uncharacterized protein n=1 Tax=Penicillium hispanicum TaxID=1080232 RepID=UPI00253F7823|nr:uncharacterized protein N7459_006487 [Penicillium hispanicum]KAJ5577523.1 hypothetical protein N7459_006487 [Penicillium hispanicum]
MDSFTDEENHSFTSTSGDSCVGAEVVVRESMPIELGTQSNPIYVDDDLAPLGSTANPIIIHDDWSHDEAELPDSDADTEIVTTPKFWEMIDRAFPTSASDGTSASIGAPGRSEACQKPVDIHRGQSFTNCPHTDGKVPEMTPLSDSQSLPSCVTLAAVSNENITPVSTSQFDL